ncbi:MAG TPA: alpha-amylase [Candidatus Coprenecus stercoravium]|uniref:Alpha-amylase n=1 Tax=Candidatus Coprenecus stercoravium TaxID=2840735 RepID=A0A9D2GS92_9BACT|nr:alpha-amylase [Candidatus Coprenecus stercoravium]
MKGKFIIYQMLPRLMGDATRNGKFKDITAPVLEQIRNLNVNYIWYTGIIRHAVPGDEGVKGNAGSPFAIVDYYDVNPYLASRECNRMKEFESLVARTKAAGMEVILDFVPNHVSPSYKSAVRPFEERNFHPGHIHDYDWSDTVKLNYNDRDTWEKMRDILLFWASKGVGGFRCDMVELVPVEFWGWCIPEVKKLYPKIIFIGEAYEPDNYSALIEKGRFDYLYDKSGFYDTLKKIVRGEAPASAITGVWQKLGKYQEHMLNFLENHDEDRISSQDFAGSPFGALAALFVSLFFNTSPFMIYFGQEFGEGPEKTSIFDFCELPKVRAWMRGLKAGDPMKYLGYEEQALYVVYREFMKKATEPAIRKGDTYDLEYANPKSEYFDPDKHFVFMRKSGSSVYLCAANFSSDRVQIKVNIPRHAFEYFGIEETDALNSNTPVDVRIASDAGTLLKLM